MNRQPDSQPDRIEREHRIIKVHGGYRFDEPCGCREVCGDFTDDEEGICISLPRAPEPPLVELVVVHRDDLRRGSA